jgi:hypothetical protein
MSIVVLRSVCLSVNLSLSLSVSVYLSLPLYPCIDTMYSVPRFPRRINMGPSAPYANRYTNSCINIIA